MMKNSTWQLDLFAENILTKPLDTDYDPLRLKYVFDDLNSFPRGRKYYIVATHKPTGIFTIIENMNNLQHFYRRAYRVVVDEK